MTPSSGKVLRTIVSSWCDTELRRALRDDWTPSVGPPYSVEVLLEHAGSADVLSLWERLRVAADEREILGFIEDVLANVPTVPGEAGPDRLEVGSSMAIGRAEVAASYLLILTSSIPLRDLKEAVWQNIFTRKHVWPSALISILRKVMDDVEILERSAAFVESVSSRDYANARTEFYFLRNTGDFHEVLDRMALRTDSKFFRRKYKAAMRGRF